MKYIAITLICISIFTYRLQANDYKMINIQKDTFDLIKMSKEKYLFVITYSYGYTCFDCFKYLIKSLDSLKKYYNNVDYLFIAKVQNSSQSRRENIKNIQVIDKNINVYFDIYDENILTSGLFAKYKIDKTPTILFIKNNEVTHIPYNDFNFEKNNTFQKLKQCISIE